MDITAYTVISRDVELLDWCINLARQRQGYECEWLVIGWDATYDIRNWCQDNKVRFVNLKMEDMGPDKDTFAFLRNLYKAWNAGYEHANTDWVVRMGSDQAFSIGWLRNLVDAVEVKGERAIYHCHTCESLVARNSRHDVRDFGELWNTFDDHSFDIYAANIETEYVGRMIQAAEECNLFFRHPSRGVQLRPDGCTWLQSKALWEEFGPISDQIENGVTGDVSYMDKMYDNGVPGYLVRNSTTYHLVRGESRETQK